LPLTACLAVLSLCAACGSEQPTPAAESAAAPAPAPARVTAVPVEYATGFFDAEKDDTGLVWRWMQKDGVVRLGNAGGGATLRIKAAAPVANATFRLELNGQRLDEFVSPGGDLTKEYTLSAEQQGTGSSSQLHITTSAALTTPRDPRPLGLRVFDISLTPQ
jgi:hypothetical protein